MDKHIIFTVYIILTLALSSSLGTLTMAVFAMLCGIEVRTLSFGNGPKLVDSKMGSTQIHIACIPLGAYMRVTDNRIEELSGDPARSFDRLHPIIRFCILMSGVLLPLIPAIILLPDELLARSYTAIPQLVLGAISPFGYAQELLEKAYLLSQSKGSVFVMSVILLKVTVFYLLPLSPTYGMGQGLAAMRSKPLGDKMVNFSIVSTIMLIILCVSWLIAVVSYTFLSR